MSNMVYTRAYRILRAMKRYKNLMDDQLVDDISYPTIQNGEYFIGVYINDPDTTEDQIIITNKGFYTGHTVFWVSIPFVDIIDVHGPPDKMSVGGLLLVLQDGKTVILPVYGVDGKFRDAFEFLRFVRRVCEDLKKGD